MLPPGEYKRRVKWTCHSDSAFSHISWALEYLFMLFILFFGFIIQSTCGCIFCLVVSVALLLHFIVILPVLTNYNDVNISPHHTPCASDSAGVSRSHCAQYKLTYLLTYLLNDNDDDDDDGRHLPSCVSPVCTVRRHALSVTSSSLAQPSTSPLINVLTHLPPPSLTGDRSLSVP